MVGLFAGWLVGPVSSRVSSTNAPGRSHPPARCAPKRGALAVRRTGAPLSLAHARRRATRTSITAAVAHSTTVTSFVVESFLRAGYDGLSPLSMEPYDGLSPLIVTVSFWAFAIFVS